LESLCSPEFEQRFIIAIVELQGKLKRKHERNYGGGALSDALLGSGEFIAVPRLHNPPRPCEYFLGQGKRAGDKTP